MSEQKIVPSLWFNKEAEEAAKFYTSLFKNSEIRDNASYSEAGQQVHGQKPGSVMTVEYALDGFRFSALNGGPAFKFNPSISFFVNCQSEGEVDALWEELAQDGSVLMPLQAYPFSDRYGWVADRYGLSALCFRRRSEVVDHSLSDVRWRPGRAGGGGHGLLHLVVL